MLKKIYIIYIKIGGILNMCSSYPSCSICKMWGVKEEHFHKEVGIEGILIKDDIKYDEYSIKAENKILEEGDIIYKYFSNESLIHKIRANQNIASKALCMCEDCILESLRPEYLVHYGDGVYASYHENLRDSSLSPIIKQTHGINIDNMEYRVKIRIISKEKFKKINKTGGVVKDIPSGGLKKGELIFAEKSSFEILGFEKWDGLKWKGISV